jgi:hypothetical protein
MADSFHSFRLGDEVDDYCVKCRRLTNHSIVSLMNAKPAKVRCRTCYHEQDFRNGEAPPKKDAKKEALFKEVLSTVDPTAAAPEEEKKPKARKKTVE